MKSCSSSSTSTSSSWNKQSEKKLFFGCIFFFFCFRYVREKIDWAYIEFADNQPILSLIEDKQPLGIVAILDEQCRFPKSDHITFAEKLFQDFVKNPYFEKPKGGMYFYVFVLFCFHSSHRFTHHLVYVLLWLVLFQKIGFV